MFSQLYNSLPSFFNGVLKLFGISSDYRILILGLNEAGKSTLMNTVIFDTYKNIPKFAFSVEQFSYKNFQMVMFDITDESVRLQEPYYHSTNAIIFIVDSNDRERLDQVKKEIFNLFIHDELKDKPLLVFANKQDIHGAMSTEELSNSLDLHSIKDRKWYVQPCSALNSQGIYEGFDWVSNNK